MFFHFVSRGDFKVFFVFVVNELYVVLYSRVYIIYLLLFIDQASR